MISPVTTSIALGAAGPSPLQFPADQDQSGPSTSERPGVGRYRDSALGKAKRLEVEPKAGYTPRKKSAGEQ